MNDFPSEVFIQKIDIIQQLLAVQSSPFADVAIAGYYINIFIYLYTYIYMYIYNIYIILL